MKRGGRRRRWWLVGLFLCGIAAASLVWDLPALLGRSLSYTAGLGTAGHVLFVLIYILACVLFLPGSVLTLGAGAAFGLWKGLLLVSLGSTLGAAAAFLFGRTLARGWISDKLAGNPRFASLDAAVGREGWKIVALARLSPVLPFNLLNFAFGLTRIKFWDYFIASWIGMMPGTLLYVYVGSVAGSLASVGKDREKTAAEWSLYGIGLLATVVVSLLLTKLARRALDENLAGNGGAS